MLAMVKHPRDKFLTDFHLVDTFMIQAVDRFVKKHQRLCGTRGKYVGMRQLARWVNANLLTSRSIDACILRVFSLRHVCFQLVRVAWGMERLRPTVLGTTAMRNGMLEMLLRWECRRTEKLTVTLQWISDQMAWH